MISGINGRTRLVGVVADPIGQLRTPQLFNASVAQQCLNAVCVPLHVTPDHLATLLDGLRQIGNLTGVVVSVPHNEAALRACGELTQTARLVGSVNVIRFERTRQVWVGGNFDGEGFLAGLRERGHDLEGKRVLLMGAGGAGKAMAFAIAAEYPRELVVFNRSADKATELVHRLAAALPRVSIRTGPNDAEGFDVVVNATSLGMRHDDPLPLDAARLAPGTLVCEAVARDPETALLAAAREHGCPVHHGQWMLYGQIMNIAQFLDIPLEPAHVARILGPCEA